MIEIKHKVFIFALLVLSVGLFLTPLVRGIYRWARNRRSPDGRKKTGISAMLSISMFLLLAIWAMRYSVGYFAIVDPEQTANTLTKGEELANSLFRTMKTFGLAEDYSNYVPAIKTMMAGLLPKDSGWTPVLQTVAVIHATLLNLAAPIAGGAILFEMLASIFPKIKLRFAYGMFWREKCYFSELNAASLALAKSINACYTKTLKKARPVLIFTDTHADGEKEKAYELLQEAKQLGAICVRDDLAHARKNRFGLRKFFLIDKNEAGNLHTLTDLAGKRNSRYLKNAEVFFFTNDDAYVQLESRLRDKLRSDMGFKEEELPVFVPVQSYRNMISNLLTDIPLYEPLIGKQADEKGNKSLTLTILGTGSIGTEMFLSAYWFGQILNCELKINILSQESESDFWGRIDYVNPEIRKTTQEDDPILKINRKGDMSPVYCRVNYRRCDVRSSVFMDCLTDSGDPVLDTDYFLVALGSDEANISTANTVRKYIGQHHVETKTTNRTVIAYVVYDPELSRDLNRKQRFCYVQEKTDIFMCAIGDLRDVYSVRNVFMTEHEPLALKAHEGYLSVQDRAQRAKEHTDRIKDDYGHWSNLARGMHAGYKVYSMGLLTVSRLDFDSPEDPVYRSAVAAAYDRYKKIAAGQIEFADEKQAAAHLALLHQMAWLEHRRWNAFTRIKGFRHTDAYETYGVKGKKGSYKQMDLKLHPCLVECDRKGIRATISPEGIIDEKTLFRCEDRSDFDLLDELSYDLYEKGYNSYDFKQYDYPMSDC